MDKQVDFIEEMLEEAEKAEEKKRIEMNVLRADQLLKAVAVIESKMADANMLADDEIRLIEEYRASELGRLDKQRSWLLFNIEAFARSTGEKTIRLPHGVLKVHKGRDRVAIIALEKFLPIGQRFGLLKRIPESYTPDTNAILAYVKRTGDVPPGTEFIPAGSKFSYSTNGRKDNDSNEHEQTEGGDPTQ